MKIEVLGTGCAKCVKLYNEVVEAVRLSEIDATVEKVEKIDEIMKRGIMMTPGLVIEGQVVSSGKVLKAQQIVELIKSASA